MTYGVIKEIHINVEDNGVLYGLEVSSCQTYLEPKRKGFRKMLLRKLS